MEFGPLELVLVMLLMAAACALIAARIRVAYPIVMVAAGVAAGLAATAAPGLPRIELPPHMAFTLFLPPILMAAAYFMPWTEFVENLRPILLLAVGLVIATTVAVAYAAHWAIGLPLAAAFVLGALVGPPDAIAATAVGRQIGLPRRVVTILEGESLINDATALVLFSLALEAVISGRFSLAGAGLRLVVVSVGGVAVGLAFGWVGRRMLAPVKDLGVVTLLSLLLPYAAYIAAEQLHVSGVLAVVAAGLYVGWHGSTTFDADQRAHVGAVWDNLIFLMNGLVFVLIGLQVPAVIEAIEPYPTATLAWAGALVAGVTIAVRMLWVFPAAHLSRLFVPFARRGGPPSPGSLIIIGWAGMRGIVSLAAALALPADMPDRGLILYLAYVVIIVTLVGQGLTLPPLIRALRLGREETEAEEWGARQIILQAGLERLEELRAEGRIDGQADHALTQRYQTMMRLWQDQEAAADVARTYRAAAVETLSAEHARLLELRRHGVITDDTFRKLERDIDLRYHALPAPRGKPIADHAPSVGG